MTKRIRFVKGTTESELFNMLGVPYGLLIVEGYQPLLVANINTYKKYKHQFAERFQLTPDEINEVEKEMVEAGLQNLQGLLNKMRQFQIPPDYSPYFHFKVCTEKNCPQPLAHGRIYTSAGECVTIETSISTLEQGTTICQKMVKNYKDNELNGITVVQQMLEADLALDDEDWDNRYNALPEEERQKYEDAIREADLPPLFGD